MTYLMKLPSPVGLLHLASDGESIVGLWIEGQKYFAATIGDDAIEQPARPEFQQAKSWLAAYFAKSPLPALPPLAPKGSEFRQKVWEQLLAIPYGKTVTYGDIAKTLKANGVSAAAQAVGGAVGHNPISILIPCHRVVGSNGSLTGYAGGVHIKKALLELEETDMTDMFVPTKGTAL